MRPRVKIVYEHWLFRFPPLSSYRGICLGRWILFKESADKISPELLAHEMVHQDQITRHGMAAFYWIYLKDYCRNLVRYRSHRKAYREIPFEKEAYGD